MVTEINQGIRSRKAGGKNEKLFVVTDKGIHLKFYFTITSSFPLASVQHSLSILCVMILFFEIIHIVVQYLLKQGVVAVVGPMTSTGVKFTQPYCAGFNIPQIAPVATDPTFSFTPNNFPFLVRLSPSDSIQCRALAGLISHYNWTQFALLTSKDDYGL